MQYASWESYKVVKCLKSPLARLSTKSVRLQRPVQYLYKTKIMILKLLEKTVRDAYQHYGQRVQLKGSSASVVQFKLWG